MSLLKELRKKAALESIERAEKLATIENLRAGKVVIYFDKDSHKIKDLKVVLSMAFPNDQYTDALKSTNNSIFGVSDNDKEYWSNAKGLGAEPINLDYFMDNVNGQIEAPKEVFCDWLKSIPGNRAFSALNVLGGCHGATEGEGKKAPVILKVKGVGDKIPVPMLIVNGAGMQIFPVPTKPKLSVHVPSQLGLFKCIESKQKKYVALNPVTGEKKKFATEEEMVSFMKHMNEVPKKFDKGTYLVLWSSNHGTFREPRVVEITKSSNKWIAANGYGVLCKENDSHHFSWFATEAEAILAVEEKKSREKILFTTEDGVGIKEGDEVCWVVDGKEVATHTGKTGWDSKLFTYMPEDAKYFSTKELAIKFMRKGVEEEARQYRRDLAEMANLLTDEGAAITLTVKGRTISLCDNKALRTHLIVVEDKHAYDCIQRRENKFE